MMLLTWSDPVPFTVETVIGKTNVGVDEYQELRSMPRLFKCYHIRDFLNLTAICSCLEFAEI
jgi:hypothetical protein